MKTKPEEATEPVIETVPEGETVETQAPEKLSLRDALEVGLEASKEPNGTEQKGATHTDDSNAGRVEPQEVNQKREGKGKARSGEVSTAAALEPPSEWSKDEKEDFRSSSPKAQEAALRLHNSRQGILRNIQTELQAVNQAKKENETIQAMVGPLSVYLKARGSKVPVEQALKEALEMHQEMNGGDPKANAAAYLKARGIAVPKELLNQNGNGHSIDLSKDPTISSLQQTVGALTSKIVQEEQTRATQVLSTTWANFEGTKNASGAPKYPDIQEETGEAGRRLASSIGSLVGGKTDLSKQFIAEVQSRVPNLTYEGLYDAAYRFKGGKVDDSEAPRSQASQEQIMRSRRAASSVPGRGARTSSSGNTGKAKSIRESLKMALEEVNDR